MSDLNVLIGKLKDALVATQALSKVVSEHAYNGYISFSGQPYSGADAIAKAVEGIGMVHMAEGLSATSVLMYPGVVLVDTDISDAVLHANRARALFKDAFSLQNKTEPTIGKANKALRKALEEHYEEYPLLADRPLPLSVKHITRKVTFLENIQRISVYREPTKRVETITAKKLDELISVFSEDKAEYYRKVVSQCDVSKLRYLYQSKGNIFRFRANAQHIENGDWENFALSLPILIWNDSGVCPSINTLEDRSKEYNGRSDAYSYQPLIEELGLYEVV